MLVFLSLAELHRSIMGVLELVIHQLGASRSSLSCEALSNMAQICTVVLRLSVRCVSDASLVVGGPSHLLRQRNISVFGVLSQRILLISGLTLCLITICSAKFSGAARGPRPSSRILII